MTACTNPTVSVVMPVYNGETFLREAIDSILTQSFTDFEFIIVDDGSTDRTAELIHSYDDVRLRLLSNPRNLGFALSLNRGLDAARGEFIARMDADDISLPERLAVQLAYMRDHPTVGVCGAARIIRSAWGERLHNAQPSAQLKYEFLLGNSLAHPTVMFRRATLQSHGLRYDPSRDYAEDYDLWARMQSVCDIANLAVPVLIYREHSAQASVRSLRKQFLVSQRVRWRLWRHFLFDPACPARFKWQAMQELLWERLLLALR